MTFTREEFEILVSRCARRAAWLIRRHGWQRGGGGHGSCGKRCAMMALWDAAEHVAGRDPERREHVATVARFRCEELIDPSGRWRHGSRRKKYLAYWNDKTNQTAEAVLAILRRVARGERAPARGSASAS